MSNENDFYMVLPSNASPDTFPDNYASDYTVKFDTPIDFNPSDRWKVALTECNYTYSPHTISTNFGIYYEKYANIIKTPIKVTMTFDTVPGAGGINLNLFNVSTNPPLPSDI